MNIALATSTYLPYTMSWIHRQLIAYNRGESVVLCQSRENEETFPIDTAYSFGEEAYWSKALKAKFGFWFGRRPIKMPAQQKREIKKLFEKHEIQLLHVHFGTYAIYFAKLCQELNIPLLVTFHGHDISSALERWPAYKQAFPSLLGDITSAIVISEEMKERLLKLGCPEEKIKVSYLGVPLDDFPFFERLHKKEKTIFLHAGRLTAKKGVPDLVKAFHAAFGSDNLAAELWIAGDGEERTVVEKTIQELDLSKSVKMLGRLEHDELIEARNKADVFVLNCRTDHVGTKEGLPISTLEAAATGLPAISTYHAGIPESIIDGKTGFLVQEYDTAGFAEAMQRLTNTQLRKEMGRKARAFMEAKFDLEDCNEVLYQIYKEAVQL